MKTPSNGIIAMSALVLAVGLMVFLFAESRNDPSLRIAALVAGTGLVSALGAIASTILTGKDVTKPDASDFPPGSVTTQASAVKIPPIDPMTSAQLASPVPFEAADPHA